MVLLRALVLYVGLIVALFGIAQVAALLSARWLGAGRFRWFDGRPLATAGWRRVAVRVVSSVAPGLATLLLLFCAHLTTGELVPTTSVDVVLPSPAASAGMLKGDRILSIDGKPLESFEELRREIQGSSGEHTIAVQRGDQQLEFRVTPAGGRIGVSPITERREHTLGTALDASLRAPITLLGSVFANALAAGAESVELAGPVAITRTSESTQGLGSVLLLVGLLSLYLSPLVGGIHVFDALTLALFRATHPWATETTADPAVRRLARLYQTLVVSLVACALLLPFAILRELAFPPALLAVLLLAPAVASTTFIAAIAAFLRWGKAGLSIALGASFMIPCANLAVAGWFAYWLHTQLERQGLRVRGLVSTPVEPGQPQAS